MGKHPKFAIKMRTAKTIGLRPAGSYIYLSHNNRTEWCRKTALKHLNDVKNSPMYTEHYDEFVLEDA